MVPPLGSTAPIWPLASVGQRLAAGLIDRLIALSCSVLMCLIGVILIRHGLGRATYPDGTTDVIETNDGVIGLGIACIVLGFVLAPLYESFMLARPGARNGQTLGMQVVGIRITTLQGGPITAGQARVRSLVAAFISGKACYLGYLWMLWDRERQTWHDKVAGTLVLDARRWPLQRAR